LGAAMAGMMTEAMRSQGSGAAPTAATTICPNCKTANPAGSKFCNSCGAKLTGTVKCPTCGTENPAGAKFCSNDGTKLS
jgi:predicted amidophosphoribosyltransferase